MLLAVSLSLRLAEYANMQDANSAAIIRYLSSIDFDKFHTGM